MSFCTSPLGVSVGPRDPLHNSCESVAAGSGWAARRLFAANSPAIGKKNNAADRPSPADHRPQGVVQRVPRPLRFWDALFSTGGQAALNGPALKAQVRQRQDAQGGVDHRRGKNRTVHGGERGADADADAAMILHSNWPEADNQSGQMALQAHEYRLKQLLNK